MLLHLPTGFVLQSFRSPVYLTEAAITRRVADVTRAQSLANELGNLIWDARGSRLRNLLAHVTLIEPKTVTDWNGVASRFKPDSDAQIINSKVANSVLLEIHYWTFGR